MQTNLIDLTDKEKNDDKKSKKVRTATETTEILSTKPSNPIQFLHFVYSSV